MTFTRDRHTCGVKDFKVICSNPYKGRFTRYDFRRLYEQYKTSERSLVAFKGGVEGTWLTTWNIPNLDLEMLGSPMFEDLPRLRSVASCGQHRDPLGHHCLQVECYHFVQWIRNQRLLQYDTSDINRERTQRFLASQKPSTPLRPAWRTYPLPNFRFFKEHMSNNKVQ